MAQYYVKDPSLSRDHSARLKSYHTVHESISPLALSPKSRSLEKRTSQGTERVNRNIKAYEERGNDLHSSPLLFSYDEYRGEYSDQRIPLRKLNFTWGVAIIEIEDNKLKAYTRNYHGPKPSEYFQSVGTKLFERELGDANAESALEWGVEKVHEIIARAKGKLRLEESIKPLRDNPSYITRPKDFALASGE